MWRKVGLTMTVISGLLAVVVGLWFIIGDQPFIGGYSEEMGLTRAQLEAFHPQAAAWSMHVYDQMGALSLGWGLFVVSIALTTLKRGERSARWKLLIAGIPTLLIAGYWETKEYLTADHGSLYSLAALIFFVIGILLTELNPHPKRR